MRMVERCRSWGRRCPQTAQSGERGPAGCRRHIYNAVGHDVRAMVRRGEDARLTQCTSAAATPIRCIYHNTNTQQRCSISVAAASNSSSKQQQQQATSAARNSSRTQQQRQSHQQQETAAASSSSSSKQQQQQQQQQQQRAATAAASSSSCSSSIGSSSAPAYRVIWCTKCGSRGSQCIYDQKRSCRVNDINRWLLR